MTPETTFDPQPTYIPKNMIILTLDDGPDGSGCTGVMGDSTSCTVLDNEFFMSQGIKADFFLNTNNRCTVAPMFGCYRYAQQLIAAGHYIGNHTVHHYHLSPGGGMGDGIMHCSDSTCVDSELSGVEQTVAMLKNQTTQNLTRFRAPFGEPYQAELPASSDAVLVEPVVAKYAVEVDWNFDSQDSNGMQWTGATLLQNVEGIIQKPGQGSWGIMLIHAVYAWTHDMLPGLIQYLQQNGFALATVEDVMCWRFGKHSWEIIPNKTPN